MIFFIRIITDVSDIHTKRRTADFFILTFKVHVIMRNKTLLRMFNVLSEMMDKYKRNLAKLCKKFLLPS